MKLYKYKQPDEPICHYNTSDQIMIPDHYEAKPFKALWVSNVLNIDMPTTKDIDTYKQKVHEIFDTCKAYHINAIIFQVRTTNDAFY